MNVVYDRNDILLINDNMFNSFKYIENESVDLIVTDPPYKITSRGRGFEGTTSSGGMFLKPSVNSGKMFLEIPDPYEFAKEFYRVLKNETHCYIMTNNKNLKNMIISFEKAGFHFIKALIWVKDNKIMSQAYMSQFEFVLFFRKGKFKRINNCGESDVLFLKNSKHKNSDGKNIHDTEKPIELFKILIENSSKVGDLVLDPFCGVCGCAVPCLRMNRKFIGIDLERKFIEHGVSLIEEL